MVLLVVLGGFGWFWVVLGGFGWFRVLVTTLESLNLSALHVQLSHQLASPNATESGAQNFDDHLVTPTLFNFAVQNIEAFFFYVASYVVPQNMSRHLRLTPRKSWRSHLSCET